MDALKRLEIDVGQDVAITDEDWSSSVLSRVQDSIGHARIARIDAHGLPARVALVSHEGFDDLGLVTDADHKSRDPAGPKMLHEVIEERLPVEGDHRFRHVLGERHKPCSFATAEQDRTHSVHARPRTHSAGEYLHASRRLLSDGAADGG